MTGNSLFDARRMFKHACSFVDCATFCEIEPKNIQVGVMNHMVADIVNSSFACEVFIKALLVYHGMEISDIKGHKLKNLWGKYREKDNANAVCVERKMKEIFNSQNENMFNELLDNISDAFEYWRYIYEKHRGRINVNFLRIFREILREVCCETFYQMKWSDYLTRNEE
ncbi:MAG: hypothetical protein IJA35_02655 [Clostridia bacterium]|nr:hypothetical protein [Clostridia bacterium]